MEYISNKVEEYLHEIRKITDINKLIIANPLCLGFVDCSNLINDYINILK